MAGIPDTSNIGQDRPIQDPEQALQQSEGQYSDAADKLSDDQRWPSGIMPKAPDPSPFTIKG